MTEVVTSLYDPSRRRIGDIPMLNTKRGIAAPRLYIWPKDGTDRLSVVVSAMVPADDEAGFVSRQVSTAVPPEALPNIIRNYHADPEGFLESFFHISLERKAKAAPPPSSSSEGI